MGTDPSKLSEARAHGEHATTASGETERADQKLASPFKPHVGLFL